ncbi:MAG: hypothetical protein WBP22_04580 [Candidatus Saccharimonas sp.]
MKQRKLNQDQLEVLQALYRFRFGTRSLLATYLDKPNNTSLYSRLTILKKYGLLDERYNSSYKLAGREAEFFISYKAAQVLKDAELIEATNAQLQATYKDKTVSDQYVQQLTLLFKMRNILSTYYDLQWFTGRDIAQLDYFPKRKPTAFLTVKANGTITRCFVEYVSTGTSISAIRGKLKQYSAYFQQDAWGVTETPFPKILYIAEDGMTEQGIRYHIKKESFRADTDIEYFTTTQKALLGIQGGQSKIWTGVGEEGQLVALEDL